MDPSQVECKQLRARCRNEHSLVHFLRLLPHDTRLCVSVRASTCLLCASPHIDPLLFSRTVSTTISEWRHPTGLIQHELLPNPSEETTAAQARA